MKNFTKSIFYGWPPTLYMAFTFVTVFLSNRYTLPFGSSSLFWALITGGVSELESVRSIAILFLIGQIALLITSYVIFLVKRKPITFWIACIIDIVFQIWFSGVVIPPLRVGFWIGVGCNTIFATLFFYFYIWRKQK